VTDANGYYKFCGLTPGKQVKISFVLPSGYSFSPKDQGMDNTKDSDADPLTGKTDCITVGNTNDLTWDAGLIKKTTTTCPGTGTPGYWKNHPEAWPVSSITIGGKTYSKTMALYWMKRSDGDKSITLFRALVAAKLNVLIGNDSGCIKDTIAAADAWFSKYMLGSNIQADSYAWKVGEPLYLYLDKYNNGGLCCPSRDYTGDPHWDCPVRY
jgi:hypothetical protein